MTARLLSLGIAVVFAVSTASDVVAEKPVALPAVESVRYDEHGAFRVNDKPFFPIALYDAPLDDATLAELRNFGFNVLACDAKSSVALREKGFYAACHADKKIDDLSSVFMGIGMDSPALNFKTDMLKRTIEYNEKTSAAVPGRPVMNAIGYWEDEPEGVIKGKVPSKAAYEDLVAAIDVSAPYLYPIPYQPVSSVGEAVFRARLASSGRKPLLPVLQIFAWDAKDRYPTPAELRCMAFLSLIQGAHGIGYYSYGTVTGHPGKTIAAVQSELWKSVKTLNHDLAEIGPQFLAGQPSRDLALVEVVESEGKTREIIPALRMNLVRRDDSFLAVVINTASTPRRAKFVRQAATFDRIEKKDGEPLELKEGVAYLPLEAFGVEILRLTKKR